MNRILIIGAGYAGILTAKGLAKRFKNPSETEITIVDRNPFHTMLTELHEVAAQRVDEDSIKISLKKVFAGRNVRVVLDNITGIDFDAKKATGENGSYAYDYLVLAAGSEPTYFGVPGAEEYAYNLWSYDDAIRLKERIESCFRKAGRIADLEKRRLLLSFYVVGAGFTGVEMIGELAEFVPILCKKFEIDPADVTMVNVDILPRAVPILPEKLSAKVEKRLAKMKVRTMYGCGVKEIGADFIGIEQNGSIVRKPAGSVIWAAGIESAEITAEAAKTLASQGRGRIKVDPFLRAEGRDDVYVVGDNMFYIPEGSQTPVPQMVENCEASSHQVVKNLTNAIRGGEQTPYRPSFHGVMVCVGGRYGVARVGSEKRMINLPSFLAMFVKHFINIVYFAQVLGWNKIFSYMKHEFFTIRNRRSFVGGHFSNRTPSFLLVPLRIWLGAVWLFEGLHKVAEGWLESPKLAAFFGGANTWYNTLLGIATDSATAATTDATTAATGEAATAAGTVLMNLDFFGFLKFIFVSGKELSQSVLSDFAFKIDFAPVNWFVDQVVLSSDGMQMFMQTTIVVLEILVGLALIGGLFTFLSAGTTLVLQSMFVMTTGLYLSTFWMIFAGIAVLIGGGMTFGLDYYVIPLLKSWWSKTKFASKRYLYHD